MGADFEESGSLLIFLHRLLEPALVWPLVVEKVGNKCDDTGKLRGNTSEPPTKTISWTFDLSILESGRTSHQEILEELFETGTSEGSVLEIDTLKERVDFDGC